MTLKEVVQDGKVIRFEGDPFEEFEFPLWVGKSWGSFQQKEGSSGSTTWLRDVSYKVAEHKSITVKAGTFEAFKIVGSWHLAQRKKSGKQSGEAIFWYAPAAKNIIKYETSHPKELIVFKIEGP